MINDFKCPSFICSRILPEYYNNKDFLFFNYVECEKCKKKKSEAELQKLIIGALIGFSRASEGNEPSLTSSSHEVLYAGLSSSFCESMSDEDNLRSLLESIISEKYALSPSCQFCEAKCGRTDDYDILRILNFNDSILFLKLLILYNVQKLAQEIYYSNDLKKNEEIRKFIYKSVSVLAMEDWNENDLLDFCSDLAENIYKTFSPLFSKPALFVPEKFYSDFIDNKKNKDKINFCENENDFYNILITLMKKDIYFSI